MRQILRVSQKSSRPSPMFSLQPDKVSFPTAEDHPEPMGHVHDSYRHWVWLGLHHHQNG